MTIQAIARIETSFDHTIELLQVGKEFCIDSRQVAPNIGIEHESFLKTLETYQTELEHFGFFRFQIGKTTTDEKGRGRPSKYVMLNRNQVLFAITLSRNTPEVVKWKMALIDALDQLDHTQRPKRRIASPLIAPKEISQNAQRILTILRENGAPMSPRSIHLIAPDIPSVRAILHRMACYGHIEKVAYGHYQLPSTTV